MATDGTKIASISFGTLANQQPAGGRIFRLAEESGETGGRLPWQLTTRIEIRRNRVLRYYAALKTSVRISSTLKQKRAGKQATTGSCPVQRILLAIDWHLFHFVSFFCQILYSRIETGP